MTTVYMVRHAEAEGNLYRRVHGWYNSLITDNGYRGSRPCGVGLRTYISTRCTPATCSVQ